ncbi:MAG: hypothetical protein ACJ73D_10805 [Pyrinomonadaceae bacterium]
MILLDANPLAGGLGIFAGIAFFLIFLAIAFIAFKLLKRTLKMAFRVAIVCVIVAIAIAGSAFFLMLGSAKAPRPPVHSQPK